MEKLTNLVTLFVLIIIVILPVAWVADNASSLVDIDQDTAQVVENSYQSVAE